MTPGVWLIIIALVVWVGAMLYLGLTAGKVK